MINEKELIKQLAAKAKESYRDAAKGELND